MHLEMQEGKEAMSQRDPENIKALGANAANLKRMTAAFAGTGRIVVADSAWGGVIGAMTLRKQGLHATMMVKGTTKKLMTSHR